MLVILCALGRESNTHLDFEQLGALQDSCFACSLMQMTQKDSQTCQTFEHGHLNKYATKTTQPPCFLINFENIFWLNPIEFDKLDKFLILASFILYIIPHTTTCLSSVTRQAVEPARTTPLAIFWLEEVWAGFR